MKYDEKSGKKKPENRSDEIRINLEKLHELHEKTEGMLDKDIEFSVLLQDISISLGLVVDLLGSMYSRYCLTEDVDHDKRAN